eukprot:gene17726-21136_t
MRSNDGAHTLTAWGLNFGTKASGLRSRVLARARSTTSMLASLLWQPKQWHPTQSCLLAKHSQYIFRHLEFLQWQGLRSTATGGCIPPTLLLDELSDGEASGDTDADDDGEGDGEDLAFLFPLVGAGNVGVFFVVTVFDTQTNTSVNIGSITITPTQAPYVVYHMDNIYIVGGMNQDFTSYPCSVL